MSAHISNVHYTYYICSMKKSAGLLICHDPSRTVLLVHPTNAAWTSTFSIPKGTIDPGETPLEAAIRETGEEIGYTHDMLPKLEEFGEPKICEYRNTKGKLYKIVYYFEVHIDEIPGGLEVLPPEQLQLDEVDWAGFLTVEAALHRVMPKQAHIIREINWK